jgi:hypothetical protein
MQENQLQDKFGKIPMINGLHAIFSMILMSFEFPNGNPLALSVCISCDLFSSMGGLFFCEIAPIFFPKLPESKVKIHQKSLD